MKSTGLGTRARSAGHVGHNAVDQVCVHPSLGSNGACPCGGCRRELGKNSDSLQCEKCLNWFCLPCTNLKKCSYLLLNKHPNISEIFPFLCISCKRILGIISTTPSSSCLNSSPLLPESPPLPTPPADFSLSEKIKSLESSLEDLKKSLSKILEDSGSSARKSVSDSVAKEFSLRRDRERRRKNVLVFGVQENVPPSREKDRENVFEIFRNLEVPVRTFRAFRIGKPVEGKGRPLLVELGGVWERNLLLGRAPRLSCLRGFERIFVRPDLPLENRRSSWRVSAPSLAFSAPPLSSVPACVRSLPVVSPPVSI